MIWFLNNVSDPVCKMKINKKDAKFSSLIKGEQYYFCSQSCKEKFDANPKPYVMEKSQSSNQECCH